MHGQGFESRLQKKKK